MQDIYPSESPSFIYRDYTVLRESKLKYTICVIATQITIILLMTGLSFMVYAQEVKTKYALNEQRWVCETLGEVAILYAGIVIF